MTDTREKLQSLAIDRDEGGSGGAGMGALAGVGVLALLIGAGLGWTLKPAPDAPAPAPPAASEPARAASPASAEPASASPAPAARARASGLVASGYVVARRQATVSAEITGRISEVLIEEGAEVTAGQVLARLDDTRARFDLATARAGLAASRDTVRSLEAQLREAEIVVERAERLVEREFASEATLTAAQASRDSLAARLEAARADVERDEAVVDSAEDFIDRHVVRAPFSGVVIAKNAQVGEILSPVSAGGGFTRTGVATLVDMDSLEIEVDVNEGQIQRVSPGQPVEAVLDAYPDTPLEARVEAIIPTADRARATIQVRVAFVERDARILPDMAARVTFLE